MCTYRYNNDHQQGYYKLPSNGKWVDTLKCMMADETHHRDVNHTFADMKSDGKEGGGGSHDDITYSYDLICCATFYQHILLTRDI